MVLLLCKFQSIPFLCPQRIQLLKVCSLSYSSLITLLQHEHLSSPWRRCTQMKLLWGHDHFTKSHTTPQGEAAAPSCVQSHRKEWESFKGAGQTSWWFSAGHWLPPEHMFLAPLHYPVWNGLFGAMWQPGTGLPLPVQWPLHGEHLVSPLQTPLLPTLCTWDMDSLPISGQRHEM